MKQKFNAGAELDILTKRELSSALKEWMVDVAKGCRPIRINAQGVAGSDGTVTIGGAATLTGGKLGPAPGFWWAITRIAVRVDQLPAAYSLYFNGPHVNSLVRDLDGTQNGYASFGAHECLVGNQDQLVIRATSLVAGSTVTASGAAVEIPSQLLWKWLAG
jgi:hypothetical protein